MSGPEIVLVIGNRNYSSWSMRASLALARTGLPFRETLVQLERLGEPGARDQLRRLSPSSRVPALHHGDLVVWDSLAICEYLAELAPAAGLWPANRSARAVARSVSAEMHAGFAALREAMPMNLRASLPGRGHTTAALADAARVQEIWRDCRARFGGDGDLLFGAPTAADAMFAPVATRFATYGVEVDPISRRYIDALFELPEVRRWRQLALEEPWRMDQNEAADAHGALQSQT